VVSHVPQHILIVVERGEVSLSASCAGPVSQPAGSVRAMAACCTGLPSPCCRSWGRVLSASCAGLVSAISGKAHGWCNGVGVYLGVPCCMGLPLSLHRPGEDKWSGWAALRPCAWVGPVSRSAGTRVGGAVMCLAGCLPSSWRGKGVSPKLVVHGPGVAVVRWWHAAEISYNVETENNR